jgi:hypothetical protein
MANSKLDELICITGWSTAFADGQKDSSESNATENEKNIVRAMRAFFKMDVDRFNKSNQKYDTINGHLIELQDKDPITKLLSRFVACKVAFRENEGQRESNLSAAENVYIEKITEAINIQSFIKLEIREDVKDTAYNLVNEICAQELLTDKELIGLIDFEKEEGIIYERSVKPLLKSFFNSLEKNNLYDVWEANYFALIKYKSELQDLFGKMDLKEFDIRYKELKPLISNLNKEINAKEKQLAKEKADQEKQLAKEKADQEKQLAKEKAELEKQLAKEKAELEKNKTHEYSVANGIDYCRYCGKDKSWSTFDCRRGNGHKYSLKREKKINYYGPPTFEYIPICSRCGKDHGYSEFICK